MRKLMEAIDRINENNYDAYGAGSEAGRKGEETVFDSYKLWCSEQPDVACEEASKEFVRGFNDGIPMDIDGTTVEEEHVEIIGENRYDDLEDVINELSDIKEQISGLVYDAASLVEGTDEEDSAKAYWISHILGALDNDSEYAGGSRTTMQDTIDALGEGEDFEDEDEDDEWPETDGNPYGDDRHNERSTA